MAMISGSVVGSTIVISGLQDVSNAVIKAAFAGVVDALAVGYEHSRDMISATDHSLTDLAKMGHPYSAEHGYVIHDPDEIVHVQSGEYLAALKVEKPSSYADRDIIEGQVHIDDSQAQLDRAIQLGTERMRARPWAEKVVDQHGVEMIDVVEERINAALSAEGAV